MLLTCLLYSNTYSIQQSSVEYFITSSKLASQTAYCTTIKFSTEKM